MKKIMGYFLASKKFCCLQVFTIPAPPRAVEELYGRPAADGDPERVRVDIERQESDGDSDMSGMTDCRSLSQAQMNQRVTKADLHGCLLRGEKKFFTSLLFYFSFCSPSLSLLLGGQLINQSVHRTLVHKELSCRSLRTHSNLSPLATD